MPFLYVTEQGAHIAKKGSHIEVQKDGERLADMAIKDVDALIVFGGVHPTTDALLALLSAGADVAFLTAGGHFKGRAVSATGKNSLLRIAQYDTLSNVQTRFDIARRYVAAKIRNGMDVLSDYHTNGKNPFSWNGEKERLEECAHNALFKATSLESLRGYEGTGARIYFACFSRCLTHGREFPGRKYHPSTDPVNALMSFGYSFLARELQAVLDSLGLDPYIGFFHEVTYGRASLSLDLMEEFRHPFIDRLVLKLFNRRMVSDDDFETRGESPQVYLKKESLRVFIRHYEEWANEKNRTWENDREMSWRKILWKQGERLRKAIEEGVPYTPYAWNPDETLPPVPQPKNEQPPSEQDLPF